MCSTFDQVLICSKGELSEIIMYWYRIRRPSDESKSTLERLNLKRESWNTRLFKILLDTRLNNAQKIRTSIAVHHTTRIGSLSLLFKRPVDSHAAKSHMIELDINSDCIQLEISRRLYIILQNPIKCMPSLESDSWRISCDNLTEDKIVVGRGRYEIGFSMKYFIRAGRRE